MESKNAENTSRTDNTSESRSMESKKEENNDAPTSSQEQQKTKEFLRNFVPPHIPTHPRGLFIPFANSSDPNYKSQADLWMPKKKVSTGTLEKYLAIMKQRFNPSDDENQSTSETKERDDIGMAKGSNKKDMSLPKDKEAKENINAVKTAVTSNQLKVPMRRKSLSGKIGKAAFIRTEQQTPNRPLSLASPQKAVLGERNQTEVTTQIVSSNMDCMNKASSPGEVFGSKTKQVLPKEVLFPKLEGWQHFRNEKGELLTIEEMNLVTTHVLKSHKSLMLFVCNNCTEVLSQFQVLSHACRFDEAGNLLPGESVDPCFDNAIKDLLKAGERTIRLINDNRSRFRSIVKGAIKFENPWPPREHRSIIKANKCHLCGKSFMHPAGLFDHHLTHKRAVIPPPQCKKTKGTVEEEIVLQCGICGYLNFDISEVKAHLLQRHVNVTDGTPSAYTLEEVEDYAKSGGLKTQISKVIAASSPLQCEFCDFVCLHRLFLFCHMATHVSHRPLECRACNVYFNSSKAMRVHFRVECVYFAERKRDHPILAKMRFICNICNVDYYTREKLFDHRFATEHLYPIKDVANNKYVMRCLHCDTQSDTAADAITHYDSHKKPNPAEGRPYLCDTCGKTYTQSSHLWQHKLLHTGNKRHVCDIPKCRRRFSTRGDLVVHKSRHHATHRPYQCKFCNLRFKTSAVLYQHRLKHTGTRYQCDTCERQFYRAYALKNHMLVHTGERPYGCLHCEKRFRQKSDFNTHVRRVHGHYTVPKKVSLTLEQRRMKAYSARYPARGGVAHIEGWEINWKYFLRRLAAHPADDEDEIY